LQERNFGGYRIRKKKRRGEKRLFLPKALHWKEKKKKFIIQPNTKEGRRKKGRMVLVLITTRGERGGRLILPGAEKERGG